jgi:hypothetical protein
MAWSGGTFTRVDGTTGWQDDEAAGTGIEAGLMDTAFNDLATDGINQTINKAGQNSPTANLPMGGFKHTGVAVASANDEYTTQGQLTDGSFIPTFLNPNYIGSVTFFNKTNCYNGGTANVEQLNVSRSSTVGVDTAVQAGDVLYRHDIQSYSGTGYVRSVQLQATCPVAPTSGAPFAPGSYAIQVGNATGTALLTGLSVNSSGWVYVPQVYSNTTANAANVYVSGTGLLQRSTSSLRYKENVEPMTTGLDAVKQLKPVTFNEKSDDSGKVFAGLIAEDLHEQGLTEYVSYDEENRPDAIHYGNLVALAFKAIQELEAKVASLEAQVAGG